MSNINIDELLKSSRIDGPRTANDIKINTSTSNNDINRYHTFGKQFATNTNQYMTEGTDLSNQFHLDNND